MSRVYAESSAALRWLLRHREGERVQEALVAADDVVTSRLTSLEVARALQRLASTKQISPSERAACWAAYQNAAKHWKVFAATDDILDRAAEPFPVEPVRSLDAVHLATILAYGKPSDRWPFYRPAIAYGTTLRPSASRSCPDPSIG